MALMYTDCKGRSHKLYRSEKTKNYYYKKAGGRKVYLRKKKPAGRKARSAKSTSFAKKTRYHRKGNRVYKDCRGYFYRKRDKEGKLRRYKLSAAALAKAKADCRKYCKK